MPEDQRDHPIEPTVVRPASRGSEPTLVPPGGAAQAPLPVVPQGKPFGRYLLMQELGHGGMGVVWKAWDTQLRRVVALKGMLGEEFAEASQVERFMREARAAARLSHPNIVPVYDVGEQDGQHYFTAEYIEGLPLDAVMKTQVAVKQALAWVKAIAEGLHYAHEQGIVHRDVKPGNVLVDRDGKPHVMDFGLAKQVEQDGSSGPALTLSGDLLGTPRYMSPEQTRGAVAAGPASDQFSLGVVMYELLTGKLPFEGSDMRTLLNAIAEKDPPRPTQVNPRVHRDAETICLKALEKDPSRRYASLGDLAADVGRYLDGEPISARPVGLAGRLARKLQRNLLVSAVSVLAAVSACVAGGGLWLGHARQAESEHREKEAVAGWMRELSRSGDALVEAALARRAMGDLEGSRKFSQGVEEPVRELMRRDARLPEPWFYRGRILRALGREKEAEEAQDRAVERARAADPRSGGGAVLSRALYERGVLRAMRYLPRIEEERQRLLQRWAAGRDCLAAPPSLPDVAQVEAEAPDLADLRRAAERDLREAADRAAADSAFEPLAEAARGISEVLSEESAESAQGHLSRALELDPYLQEAYSALGGLATRRRAWAEATKWYTRGHEVDRGYLPHLLGIADSEASSSGEMEAVGQDGDPPRRRALDALGEALRLDPGRGEALRRVANLRLREAETLAGRGRDAEGAFREALAAAERAVSAAPDDADAVVARAVGYATDAEWLAASGKDPSDAYAKALAALAGVLSRDPRRADAAHDQGMTYWSQGEWLRRQGRDPSEAYEKALAGFQLALSTNPRSATTANDLANVHLSLGESLCQQGRDPSEEYRQAIAGYEAALSIDPQYSQAANNLANVYKAQADRLLAQRKDPSEAYDLARAGYDRALSINPRFAQAANNRANLQRAVGDRLRSQGKDPREAFGKARTDFERALSINPTYAEAANNEGTLFAAEAEWLQSQGMASEEASAKALALYEKALSLNPRLAVAAYNSAIVYESEGDRLLARGSDPSDAYARARAAYLKTLSVNPRHAQAANNLGNRYKSEGDRSWSKGNDPREAYDAAVTWYQKALSMNPRYMDALNNEANAHQAKGQWLRAHGMDPLEEWGRALAAYDQALSIDPDLWQAHLNKGLLLTEMGKLNEAIASLDAALRICPDYADGYNDRGYAHELQGDGAQAIADYDRALRLNPRQLKALVNRADVHRGRGEIEKAREDYQRALDAAPADWPYRNDLLKQIEGLKGK